MRGAVRELIDAGVQTFAVALLWSFRNPAHEERVGAIIREMAPDAFVSLSSQVSPIIGEYERTATTVLNSAGGVVPAREAARKPSSWWQADPPAA